MTLPVHQQPVTDARGLFTHPWRRWLESLERRVASGDTATLAEAVATIARALGSPDGTVANIPEQDSTDALIVGLSGIITEGRLSSGRVTVALADLEDTGEGAALVKITRDDKGRVEGTQAATTDDLDEGSNLYHTPSRALQAIQDTPVLAVANIPDCADDAAAAAASVPVSGLYRTGSTLKIRVS